MKRNLILIADDQEINRAILRQIFESHYEILEAKNGEEAWNAIKKENERIAIVLLDEVMPKRLGSEILADFFAMDFAKYIPIILITAFDSTEIELKGFESGVSDVIKKPFEPQVVFQRVLNVIELYTYKNNLEEEIERKTYKLRETNENIIDALSTVVEFRNLESGNHIHRIKSFTKVMLLRYLERHPDISISSEQVEKICNAAMMHDLGKIAIPDAILLKPGRLTEKEFDIIKTHCNKGCEILDKVSFLDDKELYDYCHDICKWHHERFDGKGYPDGLIGNAIPLWAQIVSIVDVYDALVSERCYKKALPPGEAIKMITEGQCGTFSPELLSVMLKAQGLLNQTRLALSK